jgi:hypothetical protein
VKEETMTTISPHGQRRSQSARQPFCHFPRGGAIAYLYVMPAHRGKRLGSALMSRALARLRSAGYGAIWVAVEETRLPAIEIYLRAGVAPFLHPPDPEALCARWLTVHEQLGRPGKPEQWPRDSAGFLR